MGDLRSNPFSMSTVLFSVTSKLRRDHQGRSHHKNDEQRRIATPAEIPLEMVLNRRPRKTLGWRTPSRSLQRTATLPAIVTFGLAGNADLRYVIRADGQRQTTAQRCVKDVLALQPATVFRTVRLTPRSPQKAVKTRGRRAASGTREAHRRPTARDPAAATHTATGGVRGWRQR